MREIVPALLIFSTVLDAVADKCHPRNFHDVRGQETDDYLIYGLTQDCQIFFVRPSQLSLLSKIYVNVHNSYCYPNLVQLHVKTADTLLLLIKQAGNRMCALDVQIPQKDMLFGDHIFSYSLLASLNYAACSHSPPNVFSLESDLSYLDSVYNDVVYFVDGKAEGELWTVHQFLFTEDGYLRHLDKIPINNHAKQQWSGPNLSNEYVLSLDAQRNYLYKRSRFETSFVYECAFDLMFRPDTVAVHHGDTKDPGYRPWLDGLSADGNVMIHAQTDRSVQPSQTRLYGTNVTQKEESRCLTSAPFAFDIGIVRTSTLEKMKRNPLPKFDFKKKLHKKPQSANYVKNNEALVEVTTQLPTTTRRKNFNTIWRRTTSVYSTTTTEISTEEPTTSSTEYDDNLYDSESSPDVTTMYQDDNDINPETQPEDVVSDDSTEESLLSHNFTSDSISSNDTKSAAGTSMIFPVCVVVYSIVL